MRESEREREVSRFCRRFRSTCALACTYRGETMQRIDRSAPTVRSRDRNSDQVSPIERSRRRLMSTRSVVVRTDSWPAEYVSRVRIIAPFAVLLAIAGEKGAARARF